MNQSHELSEIVDSLWIYSTHSEVPETLDNAYAEIQSFGSNAVNGLIYGGAHSDPDIKILSLRLLRKYSKATEALHAIPVIGAAIGSPDRLTRLVAMETAGTFGHAAASLQPFLELHFHAVDLVEKVTSAGNHFQIRSNSKSEAVLKALLHSNNESIRLTAASYLKKR